MANRMLDAPTKPKVKRNGQAQTEERHVVVPAPNLKLAKFLIRGNAPYVQGKFGKTPRDKIHDVQAAGSTAKKGSKREPKDFQKGYHESLRCSAAGWYGFPAMGLKKAMVSACRLVGYKMTLAKLAINPVPDGFDVDDSAALVRITKGEPEYFEPIGYNANGMPDLRTLGRWAPGWEAQVTFSYDADQFTATDVANLLMRVGLQVGIGCGRPDSPNGVGMGWGTFDVVNP